MLETIIYSNNLIENEYVRSLSKSEHISFNVRVFNAVKLCDEINERKGFLIDRNYLSDEEVSFFIINKYKNEKAFKSYSDITYFVRTLKEVRLLSNSDKELIAKLDAMNSEGAKMLSLFLKDKDYRDSVDYIRETIASLESPIFDEINYFEDEYIEPSILSLIKKSSKNTSVINLSNKTHLLVKDITPYYGEENEIECTLNKIIGSGDNLDTNLILIPRGTNHIHHLFKASLNYKIPISFISGVPIIYSSPYKLLRILSDLNSIYHFDVNGYRVLFSASSFNYSHKEKVLLAELLGRMKISFDKEENEKKIKLLLDSNKLEFFIRELLDPYVNPKEYIKLLIDFVDDMSSGIIFFINKYVKIRDEFTAFDTSSLDIIIDRLNKSILIDNENIRETYLGSLIDAQTNVSSSEPGSIHVAYIDQGFSYIRKNVYIMGLNANNFPKKTKENYLLNDENLKQINEDAKTSEVAVCLQLNQFDSLINYYLEHDIEINLSYSFFNLVDVKEVNPSSKIFDIISNQEKFKDDYLTNKKKAAHYFSSPLKANRNFADLIAKGYDINILDYKPPLINEDSLFKCIKKPVSPSSIETFYECPKKFLALKIMNVKDCSEYNSYSVIESKHFGTLIHYLLEDCKQFSKEEFATRAELLFNQYLLFNTPLIDPSYVRNQFINAAINGYNFLDKYVESIKVENKIAYGNEILPVGGRYDALALTKNGSKLLIDYKTGNKINRFHDKPDTTRQIQLYLYILNKTNDNVDSGAYFFLRDDVLVPVSYFENLSVDMLKEIRNALDNRDFPANPKDSNSCLFCPLKGFCKEAKQL